MSGPRTTQHPFGGVISFDTADETYQHPFGGVVNGRIPKATVAGSATASITETNVVNGTKTITITLTGDTWVN